MNRRVLLLGGVGLLLGLGAEVVAFGFADPRRWLPDLAVGWTFIACGLAAHAHRRDSGTGALLMATGFSWFLGNFASLTLQPLAWLAAHSVYLHRGLLIHCLLSFPTGRLSSRRDTGMTVLGYAIAALVPLARAGPVMAVTAVLLVTVAARGHANAVGSARRARAVALQASVAVALALVSGIVADLVLPAGAAAETALLVYQAILCTVAVGLLVALHRGAAESLTDLVVELTRGPAGTLREGLARALGDPTIQVGFALPDRQGYVDADGRPLPIPQDGTDRAVTPIHAEGQVVGVLLHDAAVLDDPALLASITAAASLAAANARLRADIRGQIAQVEASRRRLVTAGDAERRRLQRRLHDGAEQRLRTIAATLAQARSLTGPSAGGHAVALTDHASVQLSRTLDDLHELANGLHPAALGESGLTGAVRQLLAQTPLSVALDLAASDPPPDVAAAAYFVCSEALANIVKHAGASSGAVRVASRHGMFVVEIVDDGVGGADIGSGSGLQGLRDRVEVLGGSLTVDSPAGVGTRLTAEIPLGGETT